MIRRFGRISLMSFTLLYSGLIALLWCAGADASKLKDIRVGEYKGFTRVVLELDKPDQNPSIDIQSSNQLVVTLKKTDVNLVRKIPAKPSPHVKEIQFWQHGKALSALLFFDYPHIRYKTFNLDNPPRIALDIYPVAKPLTAEAPAPLSPMPTDDKITPEGQVLPQPPQKEASPSPQPDKTAPPSTVEEEVTSSMEQAAAKPIGPLPPENDAQALPSAPETIVVPEKSHLPGDEVDQQSKMKPMNATPGDRDSVNTSLPETAAEGEQEPVAMPNKPRLRSTTDTQQDRQPQQSPRPHQRPLQYYLVLILVAITIVILALLILMLLNREHFFGRNSSWPAIDIPSDQKRHG